MRDRGVTIVLVTHFMEEAERMCDRVALIDSGHLVALDTPAGLTARARGGKRMRFVPSGPFDERLLTGLLEVAAVQRDGRHAAMQILPGVFQTISHFTPLGAAVQALQDSMFQGFPPAAPLGVLAAYALVFGFVATRFFRWE